MTSSTHFLSLCCLQVNVSYYHGCLVSPWLPPGCQAFSYPRIDGLSRKRGSTGAEEEKNYFRDSLSFCFFFNVLFVESADRMLIQWIFKYQRLPFCSPLPVFCWIPAFISYHLLLYHLLCACLHLPHATAPFHPIKSPLSSPLPLWQVGCSRDIPFTHHPLLSSHHFSCKMRTVGNTWEHLLSVTFPLSSRAIFLPSHPPHPPIILLLLYWNRSLHLPPFLPFTPSTFFPLLTLPLISPSSRHFNWLLINRVCLKQTAFIAITKAHESVSCVYVWLSASAYV